MAVSIRYPGMQQGYDPQAVDQSFDRAFTYGRERRDEKQGLAAFDKYITGLGGQQPQQPMSIAALAPQGYPGEVERAPLPDIASGRVAQAHSGAQSPWPGAAPKQDRITPQDAARASGPPQGAIEAYIRHAAQKRGIDPEVAVKVAMSEGGVSDPMRQSDVVKNGVREQSYGPFQLYMNGGLGNEALAAGIDPRKDWQGGIDFALDKAAQGGWGPWYGAEKVGVTGRMGIGGSQQPMQVADASGGTPAPQGGPTGGSGLPDRETMLALFKSPQTRPLAIQLAQAAQAAKQGDPEGALKLEKLRLEVEAMRNPQPEAPDIVELFDESTGQPYKAQWDQQSGQYRRVGGVKAPSGTQLSVGPNGEVSFTQGSGMKLTEGQSKDVGFYTRGLDADAALANLDTQLTDWGQQNADKIPLGLGNYMKDPAFRQAKQAADSFLTAILRKDTGAAVTPQEFALYGPMFLPVPGDDPGTIEGKRRARQVALLAIRSGLGTAEAVGKANEIMLGLQPPNPGPRGAPQGNRTSDGIEWSIED